MIAARYHVSYGTRDTTLPTKIKISTLLLFYTYFQTFYEQKIDEKEYNNTAHLKNVKTDLT